MTMKKLFILLLLLQFVFNSYPRDWNTQSYIESNLKILEERKNQLDPRGIYIGDIIDFLYPITILSSSSIDYNPHTQRLSYSEYANLMTWMNNNLESISETLFFEAYYANMFSKRGVLLKDMPINKDYEVIPSEILYEDIERRKTGDFTEYSLVDSTKLVDYLICDNSININKHISEYIYQAIMNDSLVIETLCNKISNYGEEDRELITRKLFVYYFFTYFKNQPLDKEFDIELFEECWDKFIYYPWKKWILHKDREYFIHSDKHKLIPYEL